MKKDIEQAVRTCAACEENALPKEEYRAHVIMGKPWKKSGNGLVSMQREVFSDYGGPPNRLFLDNRVVRGDSLSSSPSMQTTICQSRHTSVGSYRWSFTVHSLKICKIFQDLRVSTYLVVPIQQPVKWQG